MARCSRLSKGVDDLASKSSRDIQTAGFSKAELSVYESGLGPALVEIMTFIDFCRRLTQAAAILDSALMNVSRSAFILAACVVGIP
jgi:hypothetical protein